MSTTQAYPQTAPLHATLEDRLDPSAPGERIDITLPGEMVAWLDSFGGRASRSLVIEEALEPAFEAAKRKRRRALARGIPAPGDTLSPGIERLERRVAELAERVIDLEARSPRGSYFGIDLDRTDRIAELTDALKGCLAAMQEAETRPRQPGDTEEPIGGGLWDAAIERAEEVLRRGDIASLFEQATCTECKRVIWRTEALEEPDRSNPAHTHAPGCSAALKDTR